MMKRTTSILLLSSSVLAVAATGVCGELSQQRGGDSCNVQSGCTPCCKPEFKKCIDQDCYARQFYDLQCDFGVFIDVEFLYWYANESDLTYAYKNVKEDISTSSSDRFLLPTKVFAMGSEWDPGVRVGVGYNFACDGWDTYLSWTYMHNTREERQSVPKFTTNQFDLLGDGTEVLMSPWVYNYPRIDAFDEAPIFNKSFASWEMSYNVVDLELGRKYWISKCFNLRPYAGIRGGTLEVEFDVNNIGDYAISEGIGLVHDLFKSNVSFRNNNWGVGFLTGFQPTWYFTRCFALYGNASLALLWGVDDVKRKETINVVPTISATTTTRVVLSTISTSSKTDGMQSMIDLAIGLRFENAYCSDRYRFTVDAGWEHHQWNSAIHRFYFYRIHKGNQTIFFETTASGVYDLSLGGFVLRTRLDF